MTDKVLPDTPTPPKYDPDFSPANDRNKETAKRAGLRYDPKKKAFVDADGLLARDRFFQPF